MNWPVSGEVVQTIQISNNKITFRVNKRKRMKNAEQTGGLDKCSAESLFHLNKKINVSFF